MRHCCCRKQFELEMVRHIEEHINFPSIVMYVIFNEGKLAMPPTISEALPLCKARAVILARRGVEGMVS